MPEAQEEEKEVAWELLGAGPLWTRCCVPRGSMGLTCSRTAGNIY